MQAPRFELELVGSLSPTEQRDIAASLAPARFGSLAIAWSELIRSAHPGEISLYYVLIRQSSRFIGLGVVYVIHRLDVGKFIDPRLGTITQGLARVRLHPLMFRVGFFEIPLMNLPGLLVIPEFQHAHDAIQAAVMRALRGALDVPVLCVKRHAGRTGPDTAALGCMRMPAPRDATLALDYPSFESYLAQFGRNRRRSVVKAQRRLAACGATIERLDDTEGCSAGLSRLFQATSRRAASAGQLPMPLSPGDVFFRRLHMLGRGNYHVNVVRLGGAIIAFLLSLRDGETRFVKYYGADYADSLKAHAYFNLIAHEIADAIAAGCRTLDCGVANYAYKEKLGCALHPTEYLVELYHPVLRPLAHVVSRRLAEQEQTAIASALHE